MRWSTLLFNGVLEPPSSFPVPLRASKLLVSWSRRFLNSVSEQISVVRSQKSKIFFSIMWTSRGQWESAQRPFLEEKSRWPALSRVREEWRNNIYMRQPWKGLPVLNTRKVYAGKLKGPQKWLGLCALYREPSCLQPRSLLLSIVHFSSIRRTIRRLKQWNFAISTEARPDAFTIVLYRTSDGQRLSFTKMNVIDV